MVQSDVTWNPRLTGLTESTLRNGIRQTIINFGDQQLEKFDEPFRYSPFIRLIDQFDSGVVGNLTSIKMRKEIIPTVGTPSNFTVDYGNAIESGTITSTTFGYSTYIDCTLSDNSGVLSVTAPGGTVVAEGIGSVDYPTGVVTINGFNPTSVGSGGTLSLTATPATNDVFVGRGVILSIINDDVNIVMRQETV